MTTFSNVVSPLLRVITGRLALCVAATALRISALAAQDASMHEVYQAAEQGHFAEAQGMMDQVLKDHHNSAKVHFVEAGGDDSWD